MAYLRKTLHSLGGGTPVGEDPFRQALAYAQFMAAASPRPVAMGGDGDRDGGIARLELERMRQSGADRRAALQQEGYKAYRDAADRRAQLDREMRLGLAASRAGSQEQANALRLAGMSAAGLRHQAVMDAAESRFSRSQEAAAARERARQQAAEKRQEASDYSRESRDNDDLREKVAAAMRRIGAGELSPEAGRMAMDAAMSAVQSRKSPRSREDASDIAAALARGMDERGHAYGQYGNHALNAIRRIHQAVIPFGGMLDLVIDGDPQNSALAAIPGDENLARLAQVLAGTHAQPVPNEETARILRAAQLRAAEGR